MSISLETVHCPISRRHFLVNSARATGTAIGAGVLLAACDSGGGAASSSNPVTLNVMYNSEELMKKHISIFQSLYPTITIKFTEYDPIKLNAMFAAGLPPDFVRAYGASDMPSLLGRGLASDLSSYFAKSSVLKESNLLPINGLFRWDGKTQGQGALYGMIKDFSQDATLWYNKELFDQAHIPYPSETEPLTYDELLDIGKRLTVRQNGKIVVYGLNAHWGYVTLGHILQMVLQQGGSLFNTDYTKVDFTTPEARKAIQWYVDWAQAHVGLSPLDPDDGWDGTYFPANRLGIIQFGYWFGGNVVEPDIHSVKDVTGFAPAPVMGPTRISACMTGAGAWIPANARHKDEAWLLMEYFMGQGPAQERAKNGLGIPALKSLLSTLPQQKPYQQQAYRTLQNELKYLQLIHESPYATDDVISSAFSRYIEPVMKGQVSFDQGIGQLNDTVNLLLQQGQQQVG